VIGEVAVGRVADIASMRNNARSRATGASQCVPDAQGAGTRPVGATMRRRRGLSSDA
jgi:hypothetical protein